MSYESVNPGASPPLRASHISGCFAAESANDIFGCFAAESANDNARDGIEPSLIIMRVC